MALPKHFKGNPADDISSFGETEWLPPPVFTNAAGSSGTGSGSGAATSFVPSPETVTYAGSALVFVNTYGSGVTTAFRNEIVAAENYFQGHYTNACTINCSFDLQSLSPSYGGENSFNVVTVSYATLRSALASHATSADDLAAVAALNNLADPSGGRGFYVPLGEARILGLAGAGSSIDDAVVLNSYYWTAAALQNYPNDAIATIEHEISEGGMGRIGELGIGGYYWGPMDLFRFTAAGQRDFTGGKDGLATYFSTDGTSVNTGLRYHNSVNSAGQFDGYDFADWDGVGSDSNYNDPFGPGGPGAGGTGALSATDLRIMDVLGWTQTGATTPPTVTDTGGTSTWTEASGLGSNSPVAIDGGITVSDPDNTTLDHATVSITGNYQSGEDALAFTNNGSTMGNIAVTGNSGGVLTLTSAGDTATLAQWQAALRAVTYNDSSHTPNTANRTISFVVNDGTLNSAASTKTVGLTAVDTAPTVTDTGGMSTWAEASGLGSNSPVAIDGGITVSDPDNATLDHATVSITGNYQSGEDVLAFSNNGSTMGNIAVTGNSGGVLTLTSAGDTATLAQWQAALRAVTYNDSSHTPNTANRTISFVVNDGTLNSAASTKTVGLTAVDTAPTVTDTGGTSTWTEASGLGSNSPVVIDGGITVSDPDNATLDHATVSITGNYQSGEDVLAFTNNGSTMGNISLTGNSGGVLTLTSAGHTATLARWQAALRAVSYNDTSHNPNTANRTISFVVNDGTVDSPASTKTVSITATATALTRNDFNGDGKSDILWQNSTDGSISIWEMNGFQVLASQGVSGPIPSSWQVAGTGDFFGNGRSDILWRNSTDGTVGMWEMNGFQLVSAQSVSGPVPSNWQIAGTGDFFGNGHSDILWRNTTDGTVGMWEMNGFQLVSAQSVSGPVPSNWQIAGTGDFFGNGHSDILWRNTTDGTVGMWEMNGFQLVSAQSVSGPVPSNWQIAGTGDFFGNGHSDILWRNTTDGTVGMWEMNGFQLVSAQSVSGPVPSNWQIAGTGDFFGNGHSDILWRNTIDGTVGMWEMNGFQLVTAQNSGSLSANTRIVA